MLPLLYSSLKSKIQCTYTSRCWVQKAELELVVAGAVLEPARLSERPAIQAVPSAYTTQRGIEKLRRRHRQQDINKKPMHKACHLHVVRVFTATVATFEHLKTLYTKIVILLLRYDIIRTVELQGTLKNGQSEVRGVGRVPFTH